MLVAAVDVVDAVEDGFAVGDEGGEDERGGGAQVGAHDGGGLQLGVLPRTVAVRPCTVMFAPMRLSSWTCMKRFSKMFSVMVECAFGLRGEGHELGLHVGGEAGVLLGGDVGGLEASPPERTRTLSLPNVELRRRRLRAWR